MPVEQFDKHCRDCKHVGKRTSGYTEYLDQLIWKYRYECHRWPPQETFWGSSFPDVKSNDTCGEFERRED